MKRNDNLPPPLAKLISYIESEEFRGYDPYDVLTSPIPFNVFGRWGPPVATQILKRLPINFRPLLGIRKDYNPKGMGLILKACCILHRKTNDPSFLEQADRLCDWLLENYSTGYSGMCWGYPFPWASSREFKKAGLPSVVVTSAVVDGLVCYHMITGKKAVRDAILSAARFVSKDIPVIDLPDGISFAYTPESHDVTYNASLHAAEILAHASRISGKPPDPLIHKAMQFVLGRQKKDGSWYYSYHPDTQKERRQIDFHQGFILLSLEELRKNTGLSANDVTKAIQTGLEFYKNEQFRADGQSRWRLPKSYPVDIHNQSQGIITFKRLSNYSPDDEYLVFAGKIAKWTVSNMQRKNGSFCYRKYRIGSNSVSYMRWSQAWMMLALAELFEPEDSGF